jgi:hypothetical protein
MNPLPDSVWSQGLSYADFRASIAKNTEAFDATYATPSHTADDVAFLSTLPPLRVVAIGEDWCPDVYHTLPTWARLAEELPGWELRVFPRDRHPEVMAPFVWKEGAQRIPVYAFYSAAGYLQTWWSGRGSVAQAAIDALLGGRTFAQLGADERPKVGEAFEEGYRRQFHRTNLDEILALLRAFFHRA